MGGNRILEFFDFADNDFTESWLVDENGGMSDQMLEYLYGYGGIVFWVGAGLRSLEHHANVMLGSHVFGKAILGWNDQRNVVGSLGRVCMGIRVGGRRDADGRNARRVGRPRGELFASGPLFFVDDFAYGVAHNGVGTAGTLGAKEAGDALGGEQGGGTCGARHG